MKNILVATDFSNDAYCALFYATKLLASLPCTFHILNVYDEFTPLRGKKAQLIGSQKLLPKIRDESQERLTETFHKIVLDNENPEHRFETLSKKGHLPKVVAKTIDTLEIDLVVMGNKGNTGAKDIFLGGNTIQTAKTVTQCPILAVPKEIDYKAPKQIAFVTDLKKGCSKNTMFPLLFLAFLAKASIQVMHINEEEILTPEQESNRKLLELCLADVDHKFHWVGEFDDKALVIDDFLEKMNIDMFSMAQHKRSFFERLVREPVLKDVSIYSDIPFLILPDKD
jgi:nucleotide-binding universal stress UspA family protein